MVEKTLEGFIRKLHGDGHAKYASELRSIIAMSRKRKDAVAALSSMTITLLVHIIKYLYLTQSRDRTGWLSEIKGYLAKFDIRNMGPRGTPWLTLEYIQQDLNDVLSSQSFSYYLKGELKGYPDKDVNGILVGLKTNKTLRSLGVKLLYGPEGNIQLSIDNMVL
jgi:hypothetical protein